MSVDEAPEESTCMDADDTDSAPEDVAALNWIVGT